MSGTKRRPRARAPATPITPYATELYAEMGKLLCTCVPEPRRIHPNCSCPGCQKWLDLQTELNNELQCKPWQWPCVRRRGPKHAGSRRMSRPLSSSKSKANRNTRPSCRR
jgi:hypothetical protein